MHPTSRLHVISMLGLIPLLANAAPPGAGDLLRDAPGAAATVPAPRADVQALPAAPAEAQAAIMSDGLRVRVKSVRVSGVRSLPQAQVLALVSDAQGQDLNFRQLQALAERIGSHYRTQGFLLARAYLPAQKIADGEVEIAVLEGALSKVNVETTAPVQREQVQPFLGGLRIGEPLRNAQLERELLILSDLPGVRVQSLLRPGESLGTTELDVQVRNERRLNTSLALDNHGNRYTGEWRLTGRMNVASPLRFGDSLDLTLSSTGSRYRYGRAAWQTPLGGAGLQVGAAASLMDYRLGKEFAALDAHGRATDFTVYALQPILRSRTSNLQGQAAFDWKRFDDTANGALAQKRVQVLALSLSGNHQYAYGGYSVGSIGLSLGRLQLGDVARANDALGYKTHGSYTKLTAQAEYQHPWTANLSAIVKLGGQRAGKNLDSSEKMGLGGPQAVRAYAIGEASSDDSLIASLELQQAYGQARFKLFVDTAYGRVAHSPLPTDIDNSRHLSGAGLGADLTLPGELLLQSSVAWRLGDAANADLDRNPRFWVQLGKNF